MSEINRVYDKLFKDDEAIKLASQKVQLSLIDDIKNAVKATEAFAADLNKKDAIVAKTAQTVQDVYKDVKDKFGYGKQQLSKADSYKTQLEKIAKELGIQSSGSEPDKMLTKLYENIKQIQDTTANIIRNVESIGK